MTRRISRRDMLRRTALAGAGFWAAGASARAHPLATSPNEKLDIGLVGIGGRGKANLNGVSSENIVALCDVDDERAGDAYKRFPKARKFYDFRRMLDELGSKLDAVVVSTPDHTHFHPAMTAMELGLHCYCEKPMAHSVREVRAMTRLAREKKLATQLGVQRHTHQNIHRVVELIRSGAIGEVREVHSWVKSGRGMPDIPETFPPVPDHLEWDLWLGPAEERSYSPAYAPYKWRFWWDFGTGETGNWGCHILDIPFWALELTHPERVEASGPPVHPQTTPKSMEVRFDFPARGSRPPVALHWYQAPGGPAILREKDLPPEEAKKANTLFVGSKGLLLCDFKKRKLYPESDFTDFEPPPPSVPDSPGFHREWIEACKEGEPATCNFDYSGPLTETVLLGNAAYRAGAPFEWNAAKLEARGEGDYERLIRPSFREGWELAAAARASG